MAARKKKKPIRRSRPIPKPPGYLFTIRGSRRKMVFSQEPARKRTTRIGGRWHNLFDDDGVLQTELWPSVVFGAHYIRSAVGWRLYNLHIFAAKKSLRSKDDRMYPLHGAGHVQHHGRVCMGNANSGSRNPQTAFWQSAFPDRFPSDRVRAGNAKTFPTHSEGRRYPMTPRGLWNLLTYR